MSASTAPSSPDIEMIAFDLAGQGFCLNIGSVREIRGYTPSTPVPGAATYTLGVINLRGAIMPVLDLRDRLGLGRTTPTSRHVIVVVQDEERVAGLLVDAVQETLMVEAASFQPPPVTGGGDESFVDAVLDWDGRLLNRLMVASILPMACRP